MAVHAVTINLPETVYEQIRQAAAKAHRSLDEVLTEAVTAVVPVLDTPSGPLHTALAQLAYCNDATLWQAARTSMSAAQRQRLADLHDQQQRGEPLLADERAKEQALLTLYRHTLLIRAQAAALLQQRGYDVADPEQFGLSHAFPCALSGPASVRCRNGLLSVWLLSDHTTHHWSFPGAVRHHRHPRHTTDHRHLVPRQRLRPGGSHVQADARYVQSYGLRLCATITVR